MNTVIYQKMLESFLVIAVKDYFDDVVLCHTLPIFMGLRWRLIFNWDFAGAVSIFGPDALPVIHQ